MTKICKFFSLKLINLACIFVDQNIFLYASFVSYQNSYFLRFKFNVTILLKANSFLKWGFIENSKNTRILLGNCISKFPYKSWNFLENLGISKIGKQNSFYNSRNLYEIFRKFLKNPKLILEIPRFSRKFQDLYGNFEMQLPSRILVFFEFSIKPHFKKEFAFSHK